MKAETKREAAASLSGFLSAITAFSGELREYEGFCYLIEANGESQGVAELINRYFQDQFEFSFGPVQPLRSITDIEARISKHLIEDTRRLSESYAPEIIEYLAFRIMDMIGEVFESESLNLKGFELHEEVSEHSKPTIFFCVRSEEHLLVLQFNNNGAPEYERRQ